MSHLSAVLRCGEKNTTYLSPSGAYMAGSVGSIAGVVFHGLNTIGGIAVGWFAVPEPGNETMFVCEPSAIGYTGILSLSMVFHPPKSPVAKSSYSSKLSLKPRIWFQRRSASILPSVPFVSSAVMLYGVCTSSSRTTVNVLSPVMFSFTLYSLNAPFWMVMVYSPFGRAFISAFPPATVRM